MHHGPHVMQNSCPQPRLWAQRSGREAGAELRGLSSPVPPEVVGTLASDSSLFVNRAGAAELSMCVS